MIKIFYLIIALLLLFKLEGSCQQTSETAFKLINAPLADTMHLDDSRYGPVTPGINYGCLNPNRLAWFYFPVCDSLSMDISVSPFG